MQGYRTHTEYLGSLGYNSVCYDTSRIGWVSLKGIYRYIFFGCSDGMEREACVCDHGYERSDLCAEIIIIIIIIICRRNPGKLYNNTFCYNTYLTKDQQPPINSNFLVAQKLNKKSPSVCRWRRGSLVRPCLNVEIESVHRICFLTDSVDRSCFGSTTI